MRKYNLGFMQGRLVDSEKKAEYNISLKKIGKKRLKLHMQLALILWR